MREGPPRGERREPGPGSRALLMSSLGSPSPNTEEGYREFNRGAGILWEAQEGSRGPCFCGPVLTDHVHPSQLPVSDDMQMELGGSWAREGSRGKLCPGDGMGDFSWGPEAPAVSLRGEGNREGQEGSLSGKQESHG